VTSACILLSRVLLSPVACGPTPNCLRRIEDPESSDAPRTPSSTRTGTGPSMSRSIVAAHPLGGSIPRARSKRAKARQETRVPTDAPSSIARVRSCRGLMSELRHTERDRSTDSESSGAIRRAQLVTGVSKQQVREYELLPASPAIARPCRTVRSGSTLRITALPADRGRSDRSPPLRLASIRQDARRLGPALRRGRKR